MAEARRQDEAAFPHWHGRWVPVRLAGLWDRWKDRASGETIRSFTIVTTTPNDLCAPIHNRMPVILDQGDHARWLGEAR